MRRAVRRARSSLIRRRCADASFAITTVQIFISLFKKRFALENRKVSPPIRRRIRVLADSFRNAFRRFANSSRCLLVIIRFVFCFNFARRVVNASAFQVTQTSISPLSIHVRFPVFTTGGEVLRMKIAPSRTRLFVDSRARLSIKIGTCQTRCSWCVAWCLSLSLSLPFDFFFDTFFIHVLFLFTLYLTLDTRRA